MVIQLTEQLLVFGRRTIKEDGSEHFWLGFEGIRDKQRFEDQQVEIKIIS